ncbi:metalloregulator ArsR/SmtB family transcription factor [Desulfobacterales bacterium HSG16]|nr:metalloregulator ArsR/SmtB family transcription factor [Desulfobacterales bacterium HSG16]
MKNFLKVMKALSDKNRVKIAKMLQHRELCVCEIQAGLGLAQPTVSKHLKILEDAEIVSSRKEGLWVNYSLDAGNDNKFAAAILGNLRHWLEEDPEIEALMKKLPQLDRVNICK